MSSAFLVPAGCFIVAPLKTGRSYRTSHNTGFQFSLSAAGSDSRAGADVLLGRQTSGFYTVTACGEESWGEGNDSPLE